VTYDVEGVGVGVVKYLESRHSKSQVQILMVSFKVFSLLIQESYDGKDLAYARSQKLANRVPRTLLKFWSLYLPTIVRRAALATQKDWTCAVLFSCRMECSIAVITTFECLTNF
jgi:hypothetical protein